MILKKKKNLRIRKASCCIKKKKKKSTEAPVYDTSAEDVSWELSHCWSCYPPYAWNQTPPQASARNLHEAAKP